METNVQEYLSYVLDRLNAKYESVMTKLWLNDRLLTLTCFHEEKFYDFTLLSEDGLSKEDFCKGIEDTLDELIGK